ncbi:hypothetical protein [Nonomuraea sp. NPDC048901]|uniref:hypothetical protein n=1 Tax=Nonomuraea sp. NPDC048901 TaxID=3155627 RepID=UPI0033DC58BB
MSWRYLNHPCDVVSVGQQVTAEILDVDIERGRVSLSLKALQDDPLTEFARKVGSLLSGPVTKIVPFGVFVRVEDRDDGFEDLVQNEELSGNEVEVGDILSVRIDLVDLPRRQPARVIICRGRNLFLSAPDVCAVRGSHRVRLPRPV